ncbi:MULTISPECIES: alpha/beta hydrolase [unclassified Aureimonas]|uniref:alpha/beta hydrolase n=1 Tax=unclassified Aureimonas TaxID=2615206 RepID=UPI00070043B7|nr:MULTISPECIES: alpha/beta hydrolase [unclassified Aureimonas]KQT60668.1 esterase [Aureimonas sp. Leaf460]KQT68797.1 esterase [Aureimonas sp. Leaf427]
MRRLTIDPAVFDLSRAEPELIATNADIIAMQKAKPSPWTLPIETVRQARRDGRGTFPAVAPDPDAETGSFTSRSGHAIPLRIFRPAGTEPRGTYLHFHGGGWVFGAAAEFDPFLRRLAQQTGLVVASVDYRLAPEHPFPAGPDDCEEVALALASGLIPGLPTGFLAIGGESAGAHLSVLTLIRLRDRHGLAPFGAANLNAGCYDLSMTPSVRSWGEERLVLNTEDIGQFVQRFLKNGEDPRSAAVSPLYAGLKGLPPALFTVGTCDLLIDDTLFMAQRWLAAGNGMELSLHNAGCHVFQAFPSAAGVRSMAEIETFIRHRYAETVAGGARTGATVDA